MKSRFSNAAASKSKHELPFVQNDHWIQESPPQSVSNPPTYCIRAVGVLRYNRESDDNRINIPTILSELPPLAEFSVKCEYCGEKARPLGLTWLQEPETAQHFCCAQHQQLCKMLVKERDLSEGRCDLTTVTEEVDDNKFVEDMPIGLGAQSEVTINTGNSSQPVTETYAAAATPAHETPHVLNECQIQQSHSQSVRNPPTYCISTAGVLRYNRESNDNRPNVSKLPPLAKCAVKCEYCGEKASPSLDLTWLHKPKTAQCFCCAQHQQLCKMLAKERDLSEGRCGLSTTEEEDEFLKDMPVGLEAQADVNINRGYSIQAAKELSSKVLRFRLSCAPEKGNWTVSSRREPERCLTTEQEETQALVPCDRKPLKFGMCHHQDGSEFLLKYYSSGKKFLTLFRDGSSQVFYPSGQLALLVVTEENERVCIVYDDSNTPNQVMRAVFQSDGRAACYHSNGNIWLSLNTSGGECLDKTGARVRRWSWDGPLHPVFLSLNKAVGVRVLGREQVFVSFLVQGQQAKFRVGTCCAQGESDTDGSASGPSVTRYELIALAARDRTHLAIQKFQQCLMKHM